MLHRRTSSRSSSPSLGLGRAWPGFFHRLGTPSPGSAPKTSETTQRPTTLSEAIQKAWPHRNSSRYREVHVLLTVWGDETIIHPDVEVVLKNLADVFRSLYRYNVVIRRIPPRGNIEGSLAGALQEFLELYGKAGNLIIFWHDGQRHEVNSGVVPLILGLSDSDVLLLYDCPDSLFGYVTRGPGVVELLGAGASASPPVFEPLSFTRMLIKALSRQENAQYGITVADLHREIIHTIRCHCLHTDMAETFNPVPGARPLPRRAVATHPTYSKISETVPRDRKDAENITLARLEDAPRAVPEDTGKLMVKLNLDLHAKPVNPEAFRDWILKAPAEVSGITIIDDEIAALPCAETLESPGSGP